MYKRQGQGQRRETDCLLRQSGPNLAYQAGLIVSPGRAGLGCLLYTSDAADERSSVDLGGRRIIKKKKKYDTDGTGIQS